MDKAEQPTITQADIEAAFEQAAKGYQTQYDYEMDLRQAFARHRTASLAAQEVDSGMSGDAVAIIPFTNPLLSSEVRR